MPGLGGTGRHLQDTVVAFLPEGPVNRRQDPRRGPDGLLVNGRFDYYGLTSLT